MDTEMRIFLNKSSDHNYQKNNMCQSKSSNKMRRLPHEVKDLKMYIRSFGTKPRLNKHNICLFPSKAS